jgi:phospholipid transport system substrate-binding protein
MRILSAALLLLATPLVAAPPDDPREVVEARYAQIRAIMAETADDDAMRRRVEALTPEFVDFDAFAAETIRSTWNDLTDAQREAFTAAFKRLIQATYSRHFKPRQDLHISYGKVVDHGDGRATVATTLSFEKSQVGVDYRFVRKPDGHWWVTDLVIDEISLMRNYRAQFRRILKQDGFDALLARIQAAATRKERNGDERDEL